MGAQALFGLMITIHLPIALREGWRLAVRTPCCAFYFVGMLLCLALCHNVANADVIEDNAHGVLFSILDPLPDKPIATVLVLAMDQKTSLEKSSFNRSALLLKKQHEVLCISLDMPAHGSDRRPGERNGIAGWHDRLANKENIVEDFTSRATGVLNYLIEKGYTDRDRIGVIGISRGAFMALHLMAANPMIKAVAVDAPCAYLPAVREFADLKGDLLTESLSLINIADSPNLQKPIYLMVGNHDTRVGTEHSIRFAQAVVAAAPVNVRLRPIELHVVPGEDHRQPEGTHENLSSWLGKILFN